MKKDIKNNINRFEWSKLIIAGVMLFYFIVIVFGMYYILLLTSKNYPEYGTDCFKTLITLVGIPVPVGMAFYYWKAKGENIPKQYQRMLSDIEDPQLKAIFLNSIGNGNLDLTKNKLGTLYNNIGDPDNGISPIINDITTSTNIPVTTEDTIISEDEISDVLMDDNMTEEG